MTEFFFKNLSVKLFPDVAVAEGGPVCVCCSYEYQCDECSHCTDTPSAEPCTPCTETPTVECGPCTHGETDGGGPDCGGCTGGPSDECFPCTEFETDEGGGECEDDTQCIDTIPVIVPDDARASPGGTVRSPDAIRQELALLKAELRQAMGLPPEEEVAPAAGSARTVEEIDRLRDALLGAVAELEEQRAEIESTRPPE